MAKITSPALGNEVRKLENKGCLSAHERTTIRFLKAANNFLPDVVEDGADLTNAAFIFAQPGREFVVKAGGGDWEYYFSEDDYSNITGRCVRRPWLRYLWNKVTSGFSRIGGALLSIGSSGLKALMPA